MLEPTERRPGLHDLIYLSLLVLTCLMLRVPALDRVALNPDESQYEATAAYLLAADESAFVLPYTTAGSLTLYKAIAWLFGPYSMVAVRMLVLLICLAGAVMLYRVVAAEGSRLGGVVAGLVFTHYSIPFEGFTANREWFSGIALLGGMLLAGGALRRKAERRGGLLFLAGLACGVALWFKIQAAFMTLAVPAVLLWLGIVERRMRRGLAEIAFYAAGGLLASSFYCLQFFLAGTLGQFLSFLVPGVTDYVLQNESTVQSASSAGLAFYFHHFFGSLPFKPLLVVAYGMTAVCLGFAIRRLFGRSSETGGLANRPRVLLYGVYLLTALLSIGLGNRFFPHYYLFMVVPLAALIGLAVASFGRAESESRGLRVAGYGLIGLLLLGRIVSLGGLSLSTAAALRESAPFLVYLTIFLILAAVAISTARRVRSIAVALICLEVGMLVFDIQRLQPPPSLPHHRPGFDSLVQQLRTRSSADDRLFIWGWIPEIYSLTRMEPASVLTITQYVVNDDLARPTGPRLNRPMADLLMDDLERRPPRFIVDAWRRSWTVVESAEPWLYRLELYPEFELGEYIETRYEHVGRYDDCDLFVRREP